MVRKGSQATATDNVFCFYKSGLFRDRDRDCDRDNNAMQRPGLRVLYILCVGGVYV
jgi:hypothetical protein